jgi:hypothetical protein
MMSFVMGLYSLLSSAVHFCPDGYICGNVLEPATLQVCILHSDDQILTVNSFTQNLLKQITCSTIIATDGAIHNTPEITSSCDRKLNEITY